MKNILITGAGSYIGTSVEEYLNNQIGKYQISTLDVRINDWEKHDFSKYDVVYHVAGIAHADVNRVSDKVKKKYYTVNTELAVKVAEMAKKQSVRQFIFMSSIIVYGGCEEKVITCETKPHPQNFYGDSKWQADKRIRELADDSFKVAVLRPPMIYGKGSKGNYPLLARMAGEIPVFPVVKNQRSMLYVENLCEFIRLIIDDEANGVFFPQNAEYSNTSSLVKMIADARGHKIVMIRGFSWLFKIMEKIPGRIGLLIGKVFGDLTYEMSMSEYSQKNYRIVGLKESIKRTEGISE